MILVVDDNTLFRELDGEAVALDLDSGIYYGLNTAGAWLWGRLAAAGGMTRERLTAELVEEFAVDRDVAARDVGAFVEAMLASGLLHAMP